MTVQVIAVWPEGVQTAAVSIEMVSPTMRRADGMVSDVHTIPLTRISPLMVVQLPAQLLPPVPPVAPVPPVPPVPPTPPVPPAPPVPALPELSKLQAERHKMATANLTILL